ncbi:DNA-3-methyladenine glycosylase isoform X2 [Brachyhypopomus gauderio]|uniref:DNA-3-methyladenine glycosylase isoform X2 n=1 Tax=Brachyhypopomus gauderio TaxID=698409 RepID=UPI004040FB31
MNNMTTRKRKLAATANVCDQLNGVSERCVHRAAHPEGGHEDTRSQYFPVEDVNRARLRFDFFNQPCVDLAKAFLGKVCEVLVRRQADGSELRGRVVETEAYLGGEDKASHSAGGKRTERNTAMFMKPGTIYVYPIYGIYLCMNVSSQGELSLRMNVSSQGEGAAVLLRSLEPLQGQDTMRSLRAARRRVGSRALKDKDLCNGPSKLCQALDVQRCFDRRDLSTDAQVWLEADAGAPGTTELVAAPRIGIESHGEWATKPLRFYLRGHPCVSVLDRQAEGKLGPPGEMAEQAAAVLDSR